MQASPSGHPERSGQLVAAAPAQGFNAKLADVQNSTWLAAMPIVMTDHSLSTAGDAHARLMAAILQFDQALAGSASHLTLCAKQGRPVGRPCLLSENSNPGSSGPGRRASLLFFFLGGIRLACQGKNRPKIVLVCASYTASASLLLRCSSAS